MDLNGTLEIVKNIGIVLGVIVGILGLYRLFLYVKKTKQDLSNNEETKEGKLKAILSASRENRMITIHNEGSKAVLLRVLVNGVDVSGADELDISDDEIMKKGDVVITINNATNVIQPPYRLEIRYKDDYITKHETKTGKYYETFKTTV